MDEQTQEYLEQLGLPELDGPITVEMVVQKAPEEEEEETAPEAETAVEDETSSEEEGADLNGDGEEELPEDEDEETSEDDEEETLERSKITVQLNTSAAPVTAANFADLVEQNFYDAIAFHRFVDGFVAQAGDPASRDTDILEELRDLGSGQYIDPATEAPREIPLEIQVAETGEIVYNEIVDGEVELSHEQGVIAMARRNSPLDSASSQFYFTLDDVSDQLNGGYAPFGEVTDGLDDVLGIREGDRIVLARIIDGSVSSRVSEIVDDSELLNELTNKDNQNKVSYVLSMGENIDNVDNVGEDNGGTDISPLLDEGLLNSELVVPLEELPDDETDENSESEEDDDDGDVTASAIDDSEQITTDATPEDDELSISDSEVAMMGLEGDDVIFGSEGNDVISGNQGNDELFGMAGNDLLRGGKGDDILTGGKGDDFLIGDEGADILIGGQDSDSFILRGDTVEGIEDIEAADLIDDFSFEEGDRIIVIGEFVPSADFSYELVDGDTVIRLLESNYILGVVNETPIDTVEDNLSVVAADDYFLRLG
ncbi:MAG: peptidylprolyl isomerase [Microcoleaceae cyanobacterium]